MNTIPRDFEDVMDARVKTSMIGRLKGWMQEQIIRGTYGGVVWGAPRLGKTSAIEMITPGLGSFKDSTTGLEYSSAVISVTTEKHFDGTQAEGRFWDWLLYGLDCPIRSGNVGNRRHRVYGLLVDRAKRKNAKRVILIVDESQALQAHHFSWFANIFNEMNRHRIDFCLFQVGGIDAEKWERLLDDGEHVHILERFFSATMRFRGIDDLSTLKQFLKEYDSVSAKSGIRESITEYVFPEWFSGGGRLEHQAPVLLELFSEVINLDKFDLPLQHLRNVLKYALLCRPTFPDKNQLRELVTKANLQTYVLRREREESREEARKKAARQLLNGSRKPRGSKRKAA